MEAHRWPSMVVAGTASASTESAFRLDMLFGGDAIIVMGRFNQFVCGFMMAFLGAQALDFIFFMKRFNQRGMLSSW